MRSWALIGLSLSYNSAGDLGRISILSKAQGGVAPSRRKQPS
jgi:hypothetical protein